MGSEEAKGIKENNESNNDTHIESENKQLEDEEDKNDELTIKKTEFNSNEKKGKKEILYYENGKKKFEGFFKNDNAEGKGIIYFENGNKKFEGDFKNGVPEGKGILYYENGNKKYEGDYINNLKDGKGILYDENGIKKYEGYFKQNNFEGKGAEYYENGNKEYEGGYKNGEFDGKGIRYYENGNILYEGDFKDGDSEGKGIAYYENGNKMYEGDFKSGESEGKGIEYYENGNKMYEGYFKNGEFEDKGIEYYENGEIKSVKDTKIKGKEIRFDSDGNIIYATILINNRPEKIKENIDLIFDQYNDNNFIELDFISQGGYGKIYSAYSIKDKAEVCIKKISIDSMKFFFGDNFSKYLNREIYILQSLKGYKNSVYYYGDYNSNNEKVLIIEKCDENLREYMERGNKTFTNEEIKTKLKELNELFYIFQKNSIIHRDLKLENILVKYTNKEKNEFILKLTDYGIGKFINKTNDSSNVKCGTYDYIAPEILLKKVEKYDSSYDIFSLGIILYKLSHKLKHPFKRSESELFEINYINYYEQDNFDIEFNKSIDDNFKDLMKKMLRLRPENRLTWKEYFVHPFFDLKN